MTYDNALNAYATIGTAWGALPQPNKNLSNQDKNGRWILRNINGFLVYITQSGKVLDQKFKQIGDLA